jgi:ABC-type uncharacterized transport system substrate-binding protein
MEGKRLGLVRELVPTGALIAVLLNPSNANFQTQLRDVTNAARTVGQQIRVLNASNEQAVRPRGDHDLGEPSRARCRLVVVA